jgi:REP element-mobilizing transposase RayT
MVEFPNAFCHVTFRGKEGKTIFPNKRDRERFFSCLESIHHRYGAILRVYCLVDNHCHLLIETPGVTFLKSFNTLTKPTRPTSILDTAPLDIYFKEDLKRF